MNEIKNDNIKCDQAKNDHTRNDQAKSDDIESELKRELATYSDQKLWDKTQEHVNQERGLTALVLRHLEEIERRRLYAKRGLSSMFRYCAERLGYSNDEANRRIQAMRVTREVPEVPSKIEEGVLSLTHVSKVGSFLRAQKKAGKAYSPEKKRGLLQQMEGLSTRECDRRLATLAPTPAKPDREKPLSETLTLITFTADEELMKDLKKLQDLLGQTAYLELFKKMAKIALAKLEPKVHPSPAAPKVSPSPAAPKVKRPSRAIPRLVRAAVWKRDEGKCQYVDPLSKKACHCTFKPEFEHLIPFAMGGQSTVENLTLRCKAHNLLAAIEIFGAAKMEPYLRG